MLHSAYVPNSVVVPTILSSLHQNFAPYSFEENVNAAPVSTVTSGGCDSMVVSGGVSAGSGMMNHSYLTGDSSTFPVTSIARTSNLCVPGMSAP